MTIGLRVNFVSEEAIWTSHRVIKKSLKVCEKLEKLCISNKKPNYDKYFYFHLIFNLVNKVVPYISKLYTEISQI